MDACIPDHQELADTTNTLVNAMGSSTWEDVAKIEKELEQIYRSDVKAVWNLCDKTAQDTFVQVNNYYKTFFAQENWQQIVKTNYMDNKHSIAGFNEQMMKAWKGGMYYEAGQLAGLIAAIEFDMPDPIPVPVPSNVPPYAGRDLVAGIIFGEFYVDIKAGLDACYPDNQTLADDGAAFMAAAKDFDWVNMMSTCEDVLSEFFESFENSRANCDAATQQGVDQMKTFLDNFVAQDNWIDIMSANKDANLIYIQQYTQQMVKAWDNSKFYESGNLLGLINTYLFLFKQ